MRARLAVSALAFRAVFANRDLRRLQLALAGSLIGTWSYTVALSVYAYRAGGASAVGLVAIVRWLPAGLAAPWLSTLADRLPRRSVMIGADVVRCALMSAIAAVAFAGGPHPLVYALAAASAVAGTAFRPAQAAILPGLARSPDELTAANVVSSTIESAGFFAGPALGGLLLAAAGPGWVFAANAGSFLWSTLLVAGVHGGNERPEPTGETGLRSELLGGIRAVARDGRAALLVGVLGAQVLLDGALGVLVVVLALRGLHLGAAGVGYLNAAMGVGGILGAGIAATLVARRRLAGDLAAGIVLWGLPIALIGAWPREWAALLLLAIVGVGSTLSDVAGYTLLQRGVADAVLARVFGVLEMVTLVAAALGAVLAPVVYHAIGLRASLIAAGAVLPALALALAPALRAIDAASAPAAGLERLRAVPFLGLLPEPTLESLAARLATVRVAAGADVFREGDPGDRFYVIDSGEVEIAGARHGPGGYFGEIALLRDVPRTATVHAVTDVELLALERDEFIAAVTGHSPSAEAADAVIGARLPALSG